MAFTVTGEDVQHAPPPPNGALCVDCDKDTMPLNANGTPNFKAWDVYTASDAAWVEAGMARMAWGARKRWHTGFLCLSCLGRRLGREPVRGTDLIGWTISASNKGVKMAFAPEYVARVLHGRSY